MRTRSSKPESPDVKDNQLTRAPLKHIEKNKLYPELEDMQDIDEMDCDVKKKKNDEEDEKYPGDGNNVPSFKSTKDEHTTLLSSAELRARQNEARLCNKSLPKSLKRNAAISNKPLQKKHPIESTNSARSGLWKLLLGILMSIILAIWFFFYPPIPSSNLNRVDRVTTVLSGLKDSFEGQDPMTFRILKVALTKVLKPETEAPAIIILLATKGADKVCYDFAEHLVKAISPDYLNISGDHYKYQKPDLGKKDIDEKLKSNLSNDKLKAVLVTNLDKMPGKTALMFHTYCDHENAPFKQVVYVMTVAMQRNFSKQFDSRSWDEAVQNILLEAWNDAHLDQVTALLARLTVSVAAITVNK